MKCELTECEHNWEFSLEPETEVEKLALEFLASRPKDQVVILNTRLGLFVRKEEKEG